MAIPSTQISTVNFLPEIFQTPVNQQFLAATLDQLVQEPSFTKRQGFIGQRIGPGVNANDQYVLEPTAVRNNYQLEPGVCQINPVNTQQVVDAITYPGMNDALNLQGAITSDPSSLYTSEYYTWDPFVDFDKFINYAQYYWLPNGPHAVTVNATGIPTFENFTVTRSNGFYTFSGITGTNPTLTLARQGTYNFAVAQNNQAQIEYRVTNNGTTAWVIDYDSNPTLTLVRGNTYTFNLSLSAPLPFYIKTELSYGTTNQYNDGVTNNGAVTGTITFTVPQSAPATLYYCNPTEFNLRGQINIIDGTPGTGPGFWIQTVPGVNGTIPATPNISSRSVFGVVNNGTDLGTVTFNTPSATAQSFYNNLPYIGSIPNQQAGTVDLVTTLEFGQINGVSVVDFFKHNPAGIDGATDIFNRTLAFAGINTTDFDLYSVWRITQVSGVIQLDNILSVSNLSQFSVLFGNQYASTRWYKNASAVFVEMPALTATKDILYYQDGTDPNIYGMIQLVDVQENSALYINNILGSKTYTSPNGVVFTNGLKVLFTGTTVPASYANNEYYVEGVGTAIQLIPVSSLITPETYISGTPLAPDYLTINRSATNLNPWSRSNRWFQVDVINQTAIYNKTPPVFDQNLRARRPILEFRPETRLFNFGTQGLAPVNIINFSQTDALRTVNGTVGFSTDGYTLVTGSTIIFAGDLDPVVRGTVYQVEFISPDTVIPLIAEPVINLVPLAIVLADQSTVCLDGNTLIGVTYYFDGSNWIQAQQKNNVNQPPKFDVYDSNGISFSNQTTYPSSNFTGSSLTSYAVGNGPLDIYLGFPLTYLSLTNIGDIVFDNNLYSDSFVYTANNTGITVPLSTGFVRQYSDRVNFKREIGWQTAIAKSQIRQQFRFTYESLPLQLDIAVAAGTVVPAVQIFHNANFLEPYNASTGTYNYAYTVQDATTIITLQSGIAAVGDIIELQVLSNQVSATGFYQVPVNLQNNPLNNDVTKFTLGTARNHYSTIAQNQINLQGPVIGANNSRDLGNIVPYGLQILQQSSPMTLAGYFLRNTEYNIFDSLQYNSREYIKFKSLLLNTVISTDFGTQTIPQILDSAIAIINAGDTSISPFYWSDMLPTGTEYATNSTTVTAITTNRFNTVQTYDFTTSNYLGLLVYINGQLLTRGIDYEVGMGTPTLTILRSLMVGDVVTINEYNPTYGNFVPNTPTKLGLYPKWPPRIYVSPDYIQPTTVIQGHDGSTTIAFGDIRDEILLEFEKRIYSNLKNDDNPVPLTIYEVLPGFFRTTDYTESQITQILGEDFLTWVGYNKLDYTAQDYLPNNPFTYNYSTAGNRINNAVLDQGAWRGIYRYFYDTITPNLTPWEMLGFSEKPVWWDDRYGLPPYTSGNLVLWGDLERGYIADPVAPYVNPTFARSGLTLAIPVDGLGQLLPPVESVVGLYNPNTFRKSWTVGDGGPVEASWWMSSSYPFAIMRLLALTRPAEFFSLFADRDLYRYNAELGQYLYDQRYRLNASKLEIYGNGVSKASYINWIVDYNQQMGVNSTTALTTDLANIDVRLCYRMAAWTDQQSLEIYLEKSSPESQNKSLLIPPESYNLLLYKDQPYAQTTYSSVVVETMENGWAVYGYSSYRPYFPIFISAVNGITQTVSGGGATVQVPAQYTNKVAYIPYGYVFTNRAMVVDFLLSYGKYLESQGMTFTYIENNYTLNWGQMAQEFLYFTQQGWQVGTLINLNPAANQLTVNSPGSVVDNILSYGPENQLLDQNRRTFATRDLIVQRKMDSFVLKPAVTTGQAISYINLQYTDYENMIVFNNVDIFGDVIYDPITAERQNRLYLNAFNSTDWDGTLNARGFILNQNNVLEWDPNKRYTKGDIVRYKNQYYQANGLVQPSTVFDFNNWLQSNWTRIQKGLLANLANKADELANAYNTQTANLNNDMDRVAYNLIGFVPRQYMANLNLDDISQVNLYQQFIKTKGSLQSTNLFTNVALTKGSGTYKIYETWGVQIGTYGANANRSYFEINLNEALLPNNPSTVQIIQSGDVSTANQTILLSDLWSQSYQITTTNILPTVYPATLTTALPSAGYVNLKDVDITVYSLDDPSSIAAKINTIGTGTTIWVAHDNSYDWNIYRCSQIPGRLKQITNNLNGTSIAQFTAVTNLAIGDLIIIRYFATGVDGVYRVLGIPSPTQIIISYSFTNTNQSMLTGTGLAWTLQTMRVNQASNLPRLAYSTDLLPGARAWVDNNGYGHWEVLQKQSPFVTVETVNAIIPQENALFSTSVAQSNNQYSLLVGSPRANNGGQIDTYHRISTSGQAGTYAENIILTLSATNTVGYGNSLDWGNNNWAIAGASASANGRGYATVLYQIPGSNDYLQTQLLTAPTTANAVAFGTSVAISTDERWMYVGAPGENLVYAYGRVEIPVQTVTYITDLVTKRFAWSPAIQINQAHPEQLVVTLNNQLLSYPSDYAVVGANVVFATAPPPGVLLKISRREEIALTATGAGLYDLTPYLYTATNIDSISVKVNGVYQRPYIDYIFSSGLQFVSGHEPTTGSSIVVTAATYWQYMSTLPTSGLGLGASAAFGISVSTSTDGRTVMVGNINDSAVNSAGNTVAGAGSTYVFDRSTVKYLVTNTSQLTYTVPGPITQPVAVLLNGEYLTNTAQYPDGQFTVSGSNIVLSSSVTLDIGNSIEIETNQFQLVQKIVSQTPQDGSLYGYAVSLCNNDCSLYVGAPHATNTLIQEGTVERSVNQSRLYGVTVSTVANPVLTAGTTIRVNDIEVAVPNIPNNTVAGLAAAISPGPWSNIVKYYVNDRVIYNSVCYTALQSNLNQVPVAGSPYWASSFAIPNVQASLSGNLLFMGDGTTKIFDIGSVYAVAGSRPIVYVGKVLQKASPAPNYTYAYLPPTTSSPGQIAFVTAPETHTEITVVTGQLVLSVINPEAAPEYNQLTVLPGTSSSGSAFNALGFDTFIYTQTLTSPNPVAYGFFGSAVAINSNSQNVVVGAPNGDVYEAMSFDAGQTVFDEKSTLFSNPVGNSGVAYTFDYLPSYNQSAVNPGQFAFGQQIYQNGTVTGDQFGTAVNFVNGRLIVGAPGKDLGSSANSNFGSITIYDNPENSPAWTVINQQQPVVNIGLMNSVYSFDKLLNGTQTFFDYIDPLQGKILGVAARNINYIGAVDPANYNNGTIHNNGTTWYSEHVGEIWWDTDTVRFINPNQNDITYASRQWGQIFPGSRVDVYQWIESSVPPAGYSGIGTPLSTTSYTTSTALNANGVFATNYYYWVRGITSVDTTNGKDLSVSAIASYIANPIGSGIPYIAPINANTLALYNTTGLLSARDTIMHVEYERQAKGAAANIHTEYQFVAEGKATSFVTSSIYTKMVDSFCGQNSSGALVPDPFLSPGMRYGVNYRPRQSMFANRFAALQNYLTATNDILAQYPIVETRSFNLLNSKEPIPDSAVATSSSASISGYTLTVGGTITGSFELGQTLTGPGIPAFVTIVGLGTGTGGAGTYKISNQLTVVNQPITGTSGYNFTVPNLTVLGYQNLNQVPVGYLYLVLSDSDQNGKWTIYEVTDNTGSGSLQLLRIQNYDTPLYWHYINWYQPGYNSSIQTVAQVQNSADLQTLSYSTAPIGSSVQVNRNGQGLYEIYLRTSTGWDRVGLENGTIAFDEVLWNYALGPYGYDADTFDAQLFDQAPVTETRQIINAINQELFVDDLLIYRNRLLILMFKYIYSEFTAPNWLIKSSFIITDHQLQSLLPYQLYEPDDQTFVESYLTEVKPYHVQNLAFNLIYNGSDNYQGQLTDFDVPAYWNTNLEVPQFVSPVLTPYTASGSYPESFASDTAPNAAVWAETPWEYWFNNHTLSITGATVPAGGTGYTTAPAVTFGTEWTANIVYVVGQQIYYVSGPTNNLYLVTVPGTSGDAPPIFTSGSQVNGTATLTWTGNSAAGYATVNPAGQVVAVTVTDPGSGYVTTASITLSGGNGTGARAVPVMNNHMVREFAVRLKFDRYQFKTTIYEWQAGYSYAEGAQVRWLNRVWQSKQATSSTVFDPTQWDPVDAGALSGVDRTMGYYTPTANMPGLNLPLLIDGVDYPGVQVSAPNFDQDSGFDLGGYSFNPFDNLFYGPEGRPTYDPGILDAVYSSSYHDPYLGLRVTDINVVGGGYVDSFSSHAPEELIPGSEFDTLDFRVISTDGNDFRVFQDMRGFQLTYTITEPTTTTLTQAVSATDNEIHVADASALFVPDFATNQWGVLTINAERIMYRNIDLVTNTVSNLIRGSAGTAITDHALTTSINHIVGPTKVYNMSSNNLFGQQYQNYVVQDTTTANGTATVFYAPSITLSTSTNGWEATNTYNTGDIVVTGYDSNPYDIIPYGSGNYYRALKPVPVGIAITNTEYWISLSLAVQVYVGGVLLSPDLYSLLGSAPVSVMLDSAPPSGVDVTILVRRGTWVDY
jgi:hypothetical protein